MFMTVLGNTSVAQTRPTLIRQFTGIRGLGVKGEWKNEHRTRVDGHRQQVKNVILKCTRNTKMEAIWFTRLVPRFAEILCRTIDRLVPDSSEQSGGSYLERSNIQCRMPEQFNTESIERWVQKPTNSQIYKSFSIDQLAGFLLYTIELGYNVMTGTKHFVSL